MSEAGGDEMSYDAVSALENWRSTSKSHAVSISVDNGFGASCWEVTLWNGKQKLVCSEMVFIEYEGVDDHWHVDGDGTLYVSPPENDDEWPGLSGTIKCAIESATKHWR